MDNAVWNSITNSSTNGIDSGGIGNDIGFLSATPEDYAITGSTAITINGRSTTTCTAYEAGATPNVITNDTSTATAVAVLSTDASSETTNTNSTAATTITNLLSLLPSHLILQCIPCASMVKV